MLKLGTALHRSPTTPLMRVCPSSVFVRTTTTHVRRLWSPARTIRSSFEPTRLGGFMSHPRQAPRFAALSRRSTSSDASARCREVYMTRSENVSLKRAHQPLPGTHPYLLGDNELTPGTTVDEYRTRRNEIGALLSDDSIFIVRASRTKYMSQNIPYPFRQSSDFRYLTGFLEPDAVLVIYQSSPSCVTSVMFVHASDPTKELWDGPVAGCEVAKACFGVDHVYPLTDLGPRLLDICGAKEGMLLKLRQSNKDLDTPQQPPSVSLLSPEPETLTEHPQIKSFLEAALSPPRPQQSDIVQHARSVKSESEIETMRSVCKKSAEAFCEVMSQGVTQRVPDATYANRFDEFHIAAGLDYACAKRGCNRLAYPPVVAGGARANTLHYVSNDSRIQEDELVLVDCGGELDGYSADITRTWPVGGTFSQAQRDIYEAVLDVQLKCIDFLRQHHQQNSPPFSMSHLQQFAARGLTEHLLRLGVLPGGVESLSVEKSLASRAYARFYPHTIGHYLGMDVHDTPAVPSFTPLRTGHIVTVEPGLYIGLDNPSVPGT
eukprot:TRINITY_DN3688_c0_g2_i2.p1 TRINITY_DN3688_c0_g2~~TRINITY_DN3688_c0_g2_i2.p1  ORF type:complete len:547 (+),score=68.75 TRINITY_DN3688_c0_g2_i2:337-1977(+)